MKAADEATTSPSSSATVTSTLGRWREARRGPEPKAPAAASWAREPGVDASPGREECGDHCERQREDRVAEPHQFEIGP